MPETEACSVGVVLQITTPNLLQSLLPFLLRIDKKTCSNRSAFKAVTSAALAETRVRVRRKSSLLGVLRIGLFRNLSYFLRVQASFYTYQDFLLQNQICHRPPRCV